MFINEAIAALESSGIEYAIIGGMALAFHGIVRATIGVDVMINVRKADLIKLERALTALGLSSRIPVKAEEIAAFRTEYVERRNMIAWSFVDWQNPSRIIDVMIKYDLKDFQIVRIKWAGKRVPVLSLEGLLLMKKEAGRAQDKADIEQIEAALKAKWKDRKNKR